ncbi:MAG TPA: LLM class flavin-dependent oxidoreductase [Acidimicrobiia bacterium]|nr:LLM class flavin-dependent oxidoreductase [Acidimicrobiia bacterium]
MTRVPLSVLDLAIVGANRTSADALQETAALARRVEELGYTRFWVAEHHNMPSVASTTPPVLIAHVAAVTERIRVGSGGVMLPNHPPLVVAEQFAMLEALHPGRIDLGIGRAPGTDPRTAAALRRSADALGAEDFPRHLIDLMGLLGDVRAADGLWTRFAATPVATTAPEVVLLGSSGYSAQLAGILGLPFAFAHHFDTGGTLQAVELYRSSFEPSAVLAEPYMIVTANVLAAETEDEAEQLSSSGRLMMLGIRSGRFEPLQPTDAALADPRLPSARAMHSNRIAGDVANVVDRLESLVRETGADELMVSTVTYAVEDRIRSFELLASAWR